MKSLPFRSMLITGLMCAGLFGAPAFAQNHYGDEAHDTTHASSHEDGHSTRHETKHHDNRTRVVIHPQNYMRHDRYHHRHPIIIAPVVHHRHCYHRAWRDHRGRYHRAYRSCGW